MSASPYEKVGLFGERAKSILATQDVVHVSHILWEHDQAKSALIRVQALLEDPGHGLDLKDRDRHIYGTIALGATILATANSLGLGEAAGQAALRRLCERVEVVGATGLREHWLARLHQAAFAVRFTA